MGERRSARAREARTPRVRVRVRVTVSDDSDGTRRNPVQIGLGLGQETVRVGLGSDAEVWHKAHPRCKGSALSSCPPLSQPIRPPLLNRDPQKEET